MSIYMPTHTTTDDSCVCPVCSTPLANVLAIMEHMQGSHPMEWTNSRTSDEVTYYHCDIADCYKLADNTRIECYIYHLSNHHGIDLLSKRRTTETWYLLEKKKTTLEKHIIQEAEELNDLNTKIRRVERRLASDHSTRARYVSCHGLDITTKFETDVLPGSKQGLVAYLRRIRKCIKEVGTLYTIPSVMDTRDAVLDDLEQLLGPDEDVVLDDLDAMLKTRDAALDALEAVVDTSNGDLDDLEALLDTPVGSLEELDGLLD